MRYFINFRSCIVKRDGLYYYKELESMRADDFNVDEFVHRVVVDSDEDVSSEADVEESVLQRAVAYVNAHELLNVDWREYERDERPPWDVHYMHFTRCNKSVLFFRCSHSLVDGLFSSACLSVLQFKIWGSAANPKSKSIIFNFQMYN